VEYEPTGKEISIEALWDAQPEKKRKDFLIEWAKFTKMCLIASIDWDYSWDRNMDNISYLSCFINGSRSFKNRTQVMLDYMVTHGFLRVKKQGWPEKPVLTENSLGGYTVKCGDWCIITLRSNGTIQRHGQIGLDGVQTDDRGRVKFADEN